MRWGIRIALAAAALGLVALGAVQVKGSLDRRDQFRAADALVVKRFDEFRAPQSAVTQARNAIVEAIGLMDQVWSQGRDGETIDQAQASFGKAPQALGEADKANESLATLRDEVATGANEVLSAVSEARSLTDDERDLKFYDALQEAFGLLLEANDEFAKLDAKTSEGLVLYRDLFTVTDRFYKKDRSRFGNAKRAAALNYTNRTLRLTDPIASFKQARRDVETFVETIVLEAERSFETATALNRERSSALRHNVVG